MKALLPLLFFLLLVAAQIVLYSIIAVRVYKESYRADDPSLSYFPANEAVLVPGKGADTTVVHCYIRPGEVYAIRDPLEEQHLMKEDAQHHAQHLGEHLGA